MRLCVVSVEPIKFSRFLLTAQDVLSVGAEVPAAATGVYIGCVWQEYQLLLEQVPPRP